MPLHTRAGYYGAVCFSPSAVCPAIYKGGETASARLNGRFRPVPLLSELISPPPFMNKYAYR
ncbi:MAG: hypothetical protein DBX40_08405 [Clostridiales bacterium]|nr:MAG: hypothetical protein DBX40_08405 [Clostridiales bacterium]